MNKEEILDLFFKGEISRSDLQGFLDRGEIAESDIQAFGHFTKALEESDSIKTREFLEKLETSSSPSSNGKMLLFGIFGVLLLLLLSFYFLKKYTPVEDQKIDLTQFAFLYPSESNSRSNDSIDAPQSEVYLKAKTYYANSEYAQFEIHYEEYKDSLSLVEPLQLQYISSLIALKKYSKLLIAVPEINCNSTECIQSMDWYRMFSLIATDKIDEAKSILMNIQKNPDHIFYSDSEKVLQEIK